jgi:hypothetical protein
MHLWARSPAFVGHEVCGGRVMHLLGLGLDPRVHCPSVAGRQAAAGLLWEDLQRGEGARQFCWLDSGISSLGGKAL